MSTSAQLEKSQYINEISNLKAEICVLKDIIKAKDNKIAEY